MRRKDDACNLRRLRYADVLILFFGILICVAQNYRIAVALGDVFHAACDGGEEGICDVAMMRATTSVFWRRKLRAIEFGRYPSRAAASKTRRA